MVKTRLGTDTNSISKTTVSNNPVIMDNAAKTAATVNTEESVPPVDPENVTNAELYNMLKKVLTSVQKNETTMTGIQGDISHITEITNETEAVKEQLLVTQGKLTRLETKNHELENKMLEYETKMFGNDLVFYNVNEQPNENTNSLKATIYTVIKDMMKVPVAEIYSKDNIAGEIRIDTVTRMGRPQNDRNRPTLVTFMSKTAKNLAYNRKYTSNLKTPILIRVSEHYPSIIKEKRSLQIDDLKELRVTYKDSETSVTMNKDKIFLDGRQYNPHRFERNTLGSITPLSIHYSKLSHTEEHTHKNSTFQGHSLNVHTTNQAIAAKNAILQNPELSTATHIMYAYKFGIDGEATESGYSDDKEIGAGEILMDKIEQSNLTNVFICVTRLKKGSNIGPSRFTYIKRCADNLIENRNELHEPSFHNITFNVPE